MLLAGVFYQLDGLDERKIMRYLFLISILLIFSCKDKPIEPPMPKPNISGTWEGKGSKSGINYTVTVVLSQAEGDTAVIGSGDISALFVKIPFSVAGVNVYPDVRLIFTNPDPNFGTGNYVGKFDSANENKINGAATVPAFGIANEPLNIDRIK